MRGNENVWTLLALRYKKHIFAGHGSAGSGGCKTGAFGKDVYIDINVTIGNNCKIQNFASLYHGLTVGDDVFIGGAKIVASVKATNGIVHVVDAVILPEN